MATPLHRATTWFTAIALMSSSGAFATVVYRWVDEHGRTHVSDVVPDKYRRSAKPVNLGSYEPSPENRQQAEEQAARDKAAAARAPTAQAEKPSQAASAVSAPATRRPAQGVDSKTDCATWRRLYQESLACFGPYRTANGGIKPEAFDACTVIPSPDLQCGPRRD